MEARTLRTVTVLHQRALHVVDEEQITTELLWQGMSISKLNWIFFDTVPKRDAFNQRSISAASSIIFLLLA